MDMKWLIDKKNEYLHTLNDTDRSEHYMTRREDAGYELKAFLEWLESKK